jgi:hypothetical protein
MSNVKSWVGNFLTSAFKEKFQSKITFATGMMMITFFIALFACILSIVALSRSNQTVEIEPSSHVLINGVTYSRHST